MSTEYNYIDQIDPEQHLTSNQVAAALDVSPNEFALRRRLGALPDPVGVLRNATTKGRPRHLWSKKVVEDFKKSMIAQLMQ